MNGTYLPFLCQQPRTRLQGGKDGESGKGRGSSREGEGSQALRARTAGSLRGGGRRAEQSRATWGGASEVGGVGGEERGSFPPASTSLKATVGVASSRFGEVGNLRHHSIGDGYQGTEQLAQCRIEHSEQRTERGEL